METEHHATHMPTLIAVAFLILAIVGQAVAFAYVFGQLRQQVNANTILATANSSRISTINTQTNAKLDALSQQITNANLTRHYDEILLQEIAKKVGVVNIAGAGGG